MAIQRTTVIKLGSSVVVDEQDGLRREVLQRVCDEVVQRSNAGERVVVVSSGAIARGMEVMGAAHRPKEINELQAASAIGQGKLYRIYDELLAGQGLISAQVLLTFFDLSSREHYLNARETLQTLLGWGVVPIINENDTTATDEITLGDNDFLAAQVATLVEADLLVLLTDIDGVFTADPRIEPHAKLIQRIDDFMQTADLEIGSSVSLLGSGGMRSKVTAAEMATAAGIPTVIANGLSESVLKDVLDGRQVGTFCAAQQEQYSSFKHWLRYAKQANGKLYIDSGAARALRTEGRSLLPVGVVKVIGTFQNGDAVDVVECLKTEEQERPVGKGIISHSSRDLQQIIGLSSTQARVKLGRTIPDESIHRDYFVQVEDDLS